MTEAPRIVFCDFDGTITATETFADMLKEFAPELTAKLLPLMYARKITLKAGVTQILGSISVDKYPAIIKRTAESPIRSGLQEFLEFLKLNNVPFVVISGGLEGMVKAVLEYSREGKTLISEVMAIHAADIDLTGTHLQVISQWEGETELVDKVKIMSQYPAAETIAIGDSVTDINMGLQADLVFARDRLQAYLDKEGKTYIPWDNFFDIRDRLIEMWGS